MAWKIAAGATRRPNGTCYDLIVFYKPVVPMEQSSNIRGGSWKKEI